METPTPKIRTRIAVAALVLLGIGAALELYYGGLGARLGRLAELMREKESMSMFMESLGPSAPFYFIAIQAAQVVLAPIPGEATGFVGGYLFGIFPGFIFATMGLTIGSVINFFLGRFFGRKYLKFFISEKSLEKFRDLLRRQGVVVGFLLFLIPGFPKDVLCLIVGLGSMPLAVFLVISTLGRMPGTLLLAIQGASVYEAHYTLFAIVAGVTVLIGAGAALNKQRIYTFLERFK